MPNRQEHDKGFNYVSLREVMVDFKLTMGEDDYRSSATDYAIRNFALRGIREFAFDVQPSIKSLKSPLVIPTGQHWCSIGLTG